MDDCIRPGRDCAPSFEIVAVEDAPEDLKAFLYEILYRQWGVDYQSEWLAVHDGGEFLIARDQEETLIGCARIMPADHDCSYHPTPSACAGEHRLRQIVVAPHLRRQGIGTILMRAVEEYATSLGAYRVGLAARESAYAFYESCGYEYIGAEYISPLSGIPHTHMSKLLDG